MGAEFAGFQDAAADRQERVMVALGLGARIRAPSLGRRIMITSRRLTGGRFGARPVGDLAVAGVGVGVGVGQVGARGGFFGEDRLPDG